MSAAPAIRVPRAQPRPATTPQPRSEPRLRLVRPPAQARMHVPFVVLCMGILVAALLTALLLQTRLASGAYEQRSLDIKLAELARTSQGLSSELDQYGSPETLADKATALGMEPAGSVGWLRLSDGTVRGATEANG